MFRPSFVARLLIASLFVLLPVSPIVAESGSPAKITPSSTASSSTLLPEVFAGWQLTGTPLESLNPQAADSSDAAALKEYGFTRYEAANYTRDQDALTLKAIQFGDATGAFGAFTFYRRPSMVPVQIGRGAAFDGTRVLFWSGTMLVDAKFSRLTAMSTAELRDLATQLPQPMGNQKLLPTLPAYLPPRHLQEKTIQYAIGPAAYKLQGGVLPAALVDFGLSAEVVTAQYNTLNGTGVLTIINYPTPEIAIAREHAIQNFFASHGATPGAVKGTMQNSWTSALADSNPAGMQSRRSGPLVAVTSGSFSSDAAQQLLQRVHYEVDLTMSNGTGVVPDTTKVAQLILDVAFLVGIFALIAIVAAISLGGGRVLWRKMRGNSGAAQDESAEFIRLNLKD